MPALVEFICVEPDHQGRATAAGALTVNERSWAFCPSVEVDGHVWWRLAQPAEIDALRRDWRRFAPPPATDVDAGPSAGPPSG